ncbi:hypothetical protein ABBQ32_000234 [Trebouxia sp. C0010 RCD-2024]
MVHLHPLLHKSPETICSALITNSSALGQHSQQDQNMPDSTSVSWHRLLELIIKITDPKPWQAAVGALKAEAIVARLMAFLASKCSLFPRLAHMLQIACPPSLGQQQQQQPQPQQQQAMSIPETLASNLVVRFLSLQKYPEVAAAQGSLPHLLCVPLLWHRCPRVLSNVSGRLWEHVVASLHALKEPSALIAWLPNHQPDGKAGAAASLLGNLAQVSASALQGKVSKRTQEEGMTIARQFSEVVHALLLVVPMNSILAVSDTVMANVDEEDEDMQPEASTSGTSGVEGLTWPTNASVSPALSLQLHCLAEPALLKALVHQALPLPSSGTPSQSTPQQAGTVCSLCLMLQALAGVSALCQKALIFTAGPADFVRRLWMSHLKAAWAQSRWTASNDGTLDPGWMLPVIVLCRVYSTYLNTTPDAHMHRMQRPLPIEQLYTSDAPSAGLLALLKFALWQVLWVEPSTGTMAPAARAIRAGLKEAAGKLVAQLYDRDSRRQFLPAEAFQTDSLPPERFRVEMQTAAAASGGLMQATNTRVWGLLRHAPCLIAFQERAQVFTTVVEQDRREQRNMGMRQYGWGQQHFVTIHRTSLLQDGFEQLNKLGESLKSRIQIRFIDQHGMEEAGIDGGGLFKEFMECLVKEGFDPNAGLFKPTSDNRLYPNPAAPGLVPNALALFEFLGRMLGKAMYEGVLIELPLAGFFLKKMRNPHSDVNDLVTLDPELYRNLMFMRDYDGDFADLALTFTTADSDITHTREVELVPGGSSKAVTADNVVEYIHRVADYRLNYQIKAASEAFWGGFYELVARDWVTMFNEEEVQMLISGGGEGLDIADMQAHVNYAGGYHQEHPIIRDFWKVVSTFTAEQQAQLLKFITACSRAPLLGFKYLEPGLCIQMAGSSLDPHAPDRLPTAATCMNLLKLPPYPSADQIRDKLLYAATNAGGFDLS